MKKLLALAGVSVFVLVAPAAVGAASKTYQGTFDPGGQLQFKLKPTNHGKKVVKYTFLGFPVQCDGGPETTSGFFTFGVKVKNKKFEAQAQSTNPGSESKVVLTGKFKRGGKAKGTMKVSGEHVGIDDPPGTRDNCTSPKTDWTANTGH